MFAYSAVIFAPVQYELTSIEPKLKKAPMPEMKIFTVTALHD